MESITISNNTDFSFLDNFPAFLEKVIDEKRKNAKNEFKIIKHKIQDFLKNNRVDNVVTIKTIDLSKIMSSMSIYDEYCHYLSTHSDPAMKKIASECYVISPYV